MLLETLLAAAAAAIVYHHVIYPLALSRLARSWRARQSANPVSAAAASDQPRVCLIVPAHNEATVIARKVANCAAIAYSSDKLQVIIACDGCTDATVELARAAVREHGADSRIQILELTSNIGKVAVLNQAVPATQCDIVALSDASAMIESDAVQRATAHFANPRVGIVCPTYRLAESGSDGERAYWAYQTRIKADEAAVGAPIGAHGAFYLFRRDQWSTLPADTINDDVIVPMRIVAAGFDAVYDPSIVATEIEAARPSQEWRRRIRIGAGNIQQVLRLSALANPARPGLAFVFLSGKALRTAIPFIGLVAQFAMILGALSGNVVMTAVLLTEVGVLTAVLPSVAKRQPMLKRLATLLGYFVTGYAASFIGTVRYMAGYERGPWLASATDTDSLEAYIPSPVQICKRAVDVFCGLCALIVMIVLFIPIVLAIKLESRGPLFYRQLRVGRITPNATHVFYLIKFRTMYADAEATTGAVWATKNDPRITRVGNFMRKTRLDELPQSINVLRGEMSLIGPRPERPRFFEKLEDAIPYYAERTFGLKPGITGLAQVNQAYDSCIEDVRNKVLYDHAYAARIATWRGWVATDLGIMLKTLTVIVLAKGQ